MKQPAEEKEKDTSGHKKIYGISFEKKKEIFVK